MNLNITIDIDHIYNSKIFWKGTTNFVLGEEVYDKNFGPINNLEWLLSAMGKSFTQIYTAHTLGIELGPGEWQKIKDKWKLPKESSS